MGGGVFIAQQIERLSQSLPYVALTLALRRGKYKWHAALQPVKLDSNEIAVVWRSDLWCLQQNCDALVNGLWRRVNNEKRTE